MKRRTIFLKHFLIVILILTISCQESTIIEKQSETLPQLAIKSSSSSLWVDDAINYLSPETAPQPGKKFEFALTWSYENDQFVAKGAAYAKTWDYNCSDNCYAKVQILLIKDGVIYDRKATEIVTGWGDVTDPEDSSPYDAESRVSAEWSFPTTIDLSNVYIVGQGNVWGCFTSKGCSDNGLHEINWTEDKRQIFNATIPEQDPPSKPSNLQIASNEAYLTWNASERAEKYQVYRKMDYGSYTLLAATASTSYSDNTVSTTPQKNTFYYKVRAENSSGYSSFSQVVSIKGVTMK